MSEKIVSDRHAMQIMSNAAVTGRSAKIHNGKMATEFQKCGTAIKHFQKNCLDIVLPYFSFTPDQVVRV